MVTAADSAREEAWTKKINAENRAREEAWSKQIADGGGPGTHKIGEHYDPILKRTVGEYAAGDANTSFWGKAGGVLKDVAGAVGGIFGGPAGALVGGLVPSGLSDTVNSFKNSDAYKVGSSIYDNGSSIYAQYAPKKSGASPAPRAGVTSIENLPSNLITPTLANAGGAPVNNFSSPSQSYIEKNYGMAILGAGLVVMYFMFKKGK